MDGRPLRSQASSLGAASPSLGAAAAPPAAEPSKMGSSAVNSPPLGAVASPPIERTATEAQPIGAPKVPERPTLAPGVRLVGQMQESGFEDPPWLIERDQSGYIQVTDLLYRIAEHCTGENTIEEIAEKISAAGRPVRSDTLQRLVEQLLIPQGLVKGADGSVAPVREQMASPLRLAMKVRMLSPRFIEPFTGVLQYLYWPPVLISILALAAVTQWWLFFEHGIAGSVHDALYEPALLLPLLAIIIAAAAFHEFGHASALRYGGGKVRGMGVGLYLVYPAMYTDITDSYRLGRWARIRTDLGGFYFNLIFNLGIMGVYFVTHREFLLLGVLLVDLEIIHQTLPFVRLDGYWALADLTGIPDFFSQMVPFLRTVLPFPGWKGRRLPNLKWWAKAVFALYLAITMPLLAGLLFMMVKSAPRILATAWDSIGKQAHALSAAHAAGDGVSMALAGLQIGLVALPAIGMCYVLFTLGRKLGHALWNWSKPTPARRAVGSLVGAGALALIGYLWAPQLPLGGQSGPLYRQMAFQPIQPYERGTIGDAVRSAGLSFKVFTVTKPPAMLKSPAQAAKPTPKAAVTPKPTAADSANTTPTPVSNATPTAVASAAPGMAPTSAEVPTGTPQEAPTSQSGPAPTPASTGEAPAAAPTATP